MVYLIIVYIWDVRDVMGCDGRGWDVIGWDGG